MVVRICAQRLRARSDAGSVGNRGESLAQEIAVAIDVHRQVQRMLAREPFGQLGVAPLQCFDDLQVIDDGSCGPVVLRDRRAANGAHVYEKIMRCVDDGLRAPSAMTAV